MGTPRQLSSTILIGLLPVFVSLATSGADAASPLCDPSTQTCRTVVLDNNCTQDLWVGTLGNVAACSDSTDCPTVTSTCAPQGCTCSSNTDCATTQVCDTSQTPSVCRFGAPLGGGAKLAQGTSTTIDLPNQNYGAQPISWGGRFWARTGCADFDTCTPAGSACTSSAACCTNAGCNGVFTCQVASDCNSFSTCTTDGDCPNGDTCDTIAQKCNPVCSTGQCACVADGDCRDGGKCVGGLCTGQCGAGGTACQTGDCDAAAQCAVGTGGQSPTTLAEFALLSGAKNYDTYDVSQVNGFNVPIAIAPLGTTAPAPAGFANLQPWCGLPGCASGTDCPGQASACSFTDEFANCLCDWSLNEDTCPDPLQAVTPFTCTSDADCGGGRCDPDTVPNTCVCTGDSQCPGSYTCGVNANIDGKKRVCGTYAGCIDADSACKASKRLKGRFDGEPFSCKRFSDLYDCTGTHSGSCYTSGAASDCCGCPSWSNGGNTGPFPIAGGCQQSSPKWARVVDPYARSFKASCPTAYSFQYDDPTSTFNCKGKGTPIGYTITFCPTGSPGAGS